MPRASGEPGRLTAIWLVEAVRLAEARHGPYDDEAACRQARAAGGSWPQRLQGRAVRLAREHGLLRAAQDWLSGARWAALALAVLAVLAGVGLAAGALGDARTAVNLPWALGSLLGLHLLMLLAWLLSLRAGPGGGLGQAWWWLSTRLSRGVHVSVVAAALGQVMARGGLGRWALGALVHGFWTLLLLAALLTLLWMLSLRSYHFVWETTLLTPAQVGTAVRALGWLPGLMGWPLPADEAVRAAGAAAADGEARRLWATWLLGALVVYELLPRLLLLAWCLARAWQLSRGVGVDVNAPEFVVLRERLQPAHERQGVSDAAPPPTTPAGMRPPGVQGDGAMLVGIELDRRLPWPPLLPPGVHDGGVVDDGAQRRALLSALQAHPPARLLLVCDPRRSPDRGTLALLLDLARHAAQTRVWLHAPDTGGHAADAQRLADWQVALEAHGLQRADTDADALRWLEPGDG